MEPVRRFVGLRLSEALPETTILHLRWRHRLGEGLLAEIAFGRSGLAAASGDGSGPTIIAAPTSTKNREGERDDAAGEEGEPVFFGMKLHIGADAETELHSANVRDASGSVAEQQVWGDAGYVGVQKRPGIRDAP